MHSNSNFSSYTHVRHTYVCMENANSICNCPWSLGLWLYKLSLITVTCSLLILPGYFSIYFPMLLVFTASFLHFHFPLLIVLVSNVLGPCHSYLPIQPLGLVPSLELIAFAQLPQLLLASEIPSSQPAAPTAPQSSGLHGFKRLTFSFKVTFLFLHICSKFAMAILAVPPL